MSEENKNTRQDKLPEVEIDTSKPKKDTAGGEAVLQKGKFARWLENFFYHYKWHTAAVAFILIVAIVCTATMCGREKPDVQVIYVGTMPIQATQKNDLENGLDKIRNDGKKITITTYWWLSAQEINQRNKDEDQENNVDEFYLDAQFDQFNNLMMLGASSKYFIWFMSSELYDYYTDEFEEANVDIGAFFTKLDSFATANPDVVYYDDTHTAIKLSSLKAYQNPELHMLPEDTLLILRSHSGIGNKSSKKAFEASRSYIKNLINY